SSKGSTLDLPVKPSGGDIGEPRAGGCAGGEPSDGCGSSGGGGGRGGVSAAARRPGGGGGGGAAGAGPPAPGAPPPPPPPPSPPSSRPTSCVASIGSDPSGRAVPHRLAALW